MIHAVLICQSSFCAHSRCLINTENLSQHLGCSKADQILHTTPSVTADGHSKDISLISIRPAGLCNFLDAPELDAFLGPKDDLDDRWRVVYRNYATLYFVFVVDGAESELGVLDLIQVFVEALDRAFENVCELDLVFHFDEVHHILAEIIQGGLVLETNVEEISNSEANMACSKDGVQGAEGLIRVSKSPRLGGWRGCSERTTSDTAGMVDGQANRVSYESAQERM
ncbi:orange-PA [Boletus reticuloceps]|uniref:Orange-PA n=1 Tax=Boletus reticuloceps TaxID=495285 RepID=A0A8I2YY14_9AGAM|nr:orange-PA [Boletus reticuloceps]